jgi:hypothetical protein
MDIVRAKSVAFIADGALWIWERAAELLKTLGLKSEQIHFVLDFYHAVEHLSRLLELKKWPPADRKLYLTKYRRILLNGKMQVFFDFVESISRRSRCKAVIRERQYFGPFNSEVHH